MTYIIQRNWAKADSIGPMIKISGYPTENARTNEPELKVMGIVSLGVLVVLFHSSYPSKILLEHKVVGTKLAVNDLLAKC